MAGLRRGKVCAIPHLPQRARQMWGTQKVWARGDLRDIKAMAAIWRSVIQ